jgi:hypothetical protein
MAKWSVRVMRDWGWWNPISGLRIMLFQDTLWVRVRTTIVGASKMFKPGDEIYYVTWDIFHRCWKTRKAVVHRHNQYGEVIAVDTKSRPETKGFIVPYPMTKEEAFAIRLRG